MLFSLKENIPWVLTVGKMEMLVAVINSVIFQIFIKYLQLPDPVLGGRNTVGTPI